VASKETDLAQKRTPAPQILPCSTPKWRCIARRAAGAVAVAGDPEGRHDLRLRRLRRGVWKTTDGGVYWRCVSDGFLTSATIGARPVAPFPTATSMYAGTGETTIRIDVSYGDGVYRSSDAGRSWQHVGLRETRHIGRICVHPQDPDLVYVAALGDAFGPNPERGVYRSRDGGLDLGEGAWTAAREAGAVDLCMDPHQPAHPVRRAAGTARRSFLAPAQRRPGQRAVALRRTAATLWQELSGRGGLPGGLLGKHGVSASAARAGRALARWWRPRATGTGLYRSDDHGERLGAGERSTGTDAPALVLHPCLRRHSATRTRCT
jgi:hypothetical protein